MITQYPIGGNDTGYDYLRLDAASRIYLPTARTGPAPAGGGAAPILPQTFTLLVVGP